MFVRKARDYDFDSINAILDSNISYITPAHVREDLANERLYCGVDNGAIVSIISLVEEPQYNYTAMKRLLVGKEYKGKGYAQEMIKYASAQIQGNIGCTPWTNNNAMRHMLEKENFRLVYVFNGHWCYYMKHV